MENFWQIIEAARGATEPLTPSASPSSLMTVLSDLPDEDVREFMREFTRKLVELNAWDIWAAGYAITGGMSDDTFHYFRSWIIGKGKDCFDAALKDPNGLLPYLDDPEVDNELLEYAAIELLESRGIEDDPRDDVEESPDDEPSGEPFDEDAVNDRFPSLAAYAEQYATEED